MSGLAALLNSDVVTKYFPFRNATPRSSVSIQLLYDLGVIGSNSVAGVGDVSALEAKLKALEDKVDALQAELDTFTLGTNYKCDQLAIKTIDQQKEIDQSKTKLSEVETELVLHKNNGEHWTAQQIDERINAIVKP
jgi:peptidoglycan hydrolase CwlO-like protein